MLVLAVLIWPVAAMFFLLWCERITRLIKIKRRRKRWNILHS